MKYVTVEYYVLFDKKWLFLVVLVKKSIYHVTKGVKGLFFQLLVSFDFLKSSTLLDCCLKLYTTL